MSRQRSYPRNMNWSSVHRLRSRSRPPHLLQLGRTPRVCRSRNTRRANISCRQRFVLSALRLSQSRSLARTYSRPRQGIPQLWTRDRSHPEVAEAVPLWPYACVQHSNDDIFSEVTFRPRSPQVAQAEKLRSACCVR